MLGFYEGKEKEMTIHELKILPEYFQAVFNGTKPFEIRKNDRDYKVGDILKLCLWWPDSQVFSPNCILYVEITYISKYQQQEGWAVLGIKECEVPK